jgi:hypothetical protein
VRALGTALGRRAAVALIALAACGSPKATETAGPAATDEDGDGFSSPEDCDDANPDVHPDAVEACTGVDDNCDGILAPLETVDWDLDGVLACVDCNDADATLSGPNVYFLDFDGDGYGDPDASVQTCGQQAGYVTDATDCDDQAPLAHTSETFYADLDGDGYGDPEDSLRSCGRPTGYVSDATDCDDSDDEAFPGQIWYLDLDEDGFGTPDVWVEICERPGGSWTHDATDCDDLDPYAFPGATWYPDEDGDGFGAEGTPVGQCTRPEGYGAGYEDCDDADPTVFPGQLWALDGDGDGFGAISSVVESCGSPGAEWIEDATDCNDSDSGVNPAAEETCDGMDTDCDGALPADEEDADGDGYSTCEGDEDDSDPTVYPIIYEFSGILTSVAESTLIGWELCYVDYYSNYGTSFSTISASCSKARWLVGCRQTGTTTLITAANAPATDVQYYTGTSNTGHEANGVEWYWDGTYSVGYVEPGDGMSRSSCDVASGSYPDRRLCWHASSDQIQGGYRCGTATGLNSSSSYERVIFQAD